MVHLLIARASLATLKSPKRVIQLGVISIVLEYSVFISRPSLNKELAAIISQKPPNLIQMRFLGRRDDDIKTTKCKELACRKSGLN